MVADAGDADVPLGRVAVGADNADVRDGDVEERLADAVCLN